MDEEHLNLFVTGSCYGCGRRVTQCPMCAIAINVDLDTGLPPDVEIDANGRPVHVTPEPLLVVESVQQLVCDDCVIAANALRPADQRIETGTSRHDRGACLIGLPTI